MISAQIKSRPDEDISLLLTIDNHKWKYLCDCGVASRLKPGEVTRLGAIFISHTHIDHFANFDFLLRFQIGLERTISICGPAGMTQNVQGKLRSYTWNLIGPEAIAYEVREIMPEGHIRISQLRPPEWEIEFVEDIPGGIIYENEAVAVHYTQLDHGIPSVAYRFQEPDRLKLKETPYKPGPWIGQVKQAFLAGDEAAEIDIYGETHMAGEFFPFAYIQTGFRMAYVMDHAASPANHALLMDFLQGVDELYIESFYRDVDRHFAEINHHSTAKASGEIARKAGVKRAWFVHHSRRYFKEWEDLLEEARAAFEGREPAFKQAPVPRYDAS
ncbi:MAG: MBL fold metallo-hydrolase [Bacteroidota bacterium]